MEANFFVIFLSLFTSLIFVIILVIVWAANPKSIINRVFSIFLLSIIVWTSLTALRGLEITPYQEYLLNFFTYVYGVFPALFTYFFFCLIFLRKPYKRWLYFAIPTYLILSYFMTTNALVYFVEDSSVEGYGLHGRQMPGPFLYPALIFAVSFLMVLIFYLLRELRRSLSDKIYSQKVRLLLITTIVPSSFAVISNGVPLLWGKPIDIIGELVAAIILTYGILRFELIDVNVRLRNTLANIIFAILLTIIYLTLMASVRFVVADRIGDFIWWAAIVAAIYLTSVLQPLRERVLRFIDVALYRVRYDYRETINKFTSLVGEILELDRLSSFITKTIEDTFGPKSVHLFVLSRGQYQTLKGPQKLSFVKEAPIINYILKNERAIGEEEINESLVSFDEVKRLNPKVIIPLRSGKDLIGFLFIGQRISEDFYSQEDKNLLLTLGQASAIALKNALLYQEVLNNKEEIEKLLGHEREVNESKNEFVSIVSHYLRTPLTSIKGYLDLLLKGAATSKEREEYLIRVSHEQKKLSTLAEDLISISALERGELHLFKTKFSLVSLIKKVVDDNTLSVNEKGLYLKTAFDNKIDTINADSQKLAQAISNLVDNAIKFTNVGGVTIKAGKKDSKAIICVEDTGIGIDQQQIPKLFQKFHRGTDIKTFNYEGSGLGLYITKLIIEAHKGEVKVSSEPGKGSRFCVYLPRKP